MNAPLATRNARERVVTTPRGDQARLEGPQACDRWNPAVHHRLQNSPPHPERYPVGWKRTEEELGEEVFRREIEEELEKARENGDDGGKVIDDREVESSIFP